MPRTSAIGQHLLEHDHIVTFNSRHLKPVVQITNFHSVISLYSGAFKRNFYEHRSNSLAVTVVQVVYKLYNLFGQSDRLTNA